MKTKKCNRCGEIKPVESFAKNSSKKDGLQSWCKSCKNPFDKKYSKEHKEYFKEYGKQYRKEHKDYYRQYREEHKSHYIYLIYEGKEIQYLGSCSVLSERVSSHTNGYSNIAEYMKLNRWSEIKYYDIGEFLNNINERFYIEKILINSLGSPLNKDMKLHSLDDDIREEELSLIAYDILDNLEDIFQTYKINNNATGRNNMYYYIDENNIDQYEYAEDLSTFIDMYVDEEGEDEWE